MTTTTDCIARIARMSNEPGELAKVLKAVEAALYAALDSGMPATMVNLIDQEIDFAAIENARVTLEQAEDALVIAGVDA